ncbi:cold-shock protein [Alicyclobacillus fastidiosus]|uniref:Cold-shock protein n=1 Tax=Alicyclobacillus fastidiosus TaxID=392011 RepID=A0ABY6ZET5_9BACL|nr:cold-inducible protein YdjO-related protein [Alicyclobacillus fastidiosus]WAH41338.1 cold-shock protein [Alicyclobacillus fastidiosus]
MNHFNNRKRPTIEHVYAETIIWQCSGCSCWSRKEFVHVEQPVCPICKSEMKREAKVIRIE